MSSNFEKFSDESRKVVSQKSPEKGGAKFGLTPIALCRVCGLVLGMLLCLIVSNFIYEKYVKAVKQAQLVELSKQRATLTAENIQAYLQSVVPKLEYYSSQPRIKTSLQQDDTQALLGESEKIQALIDNVISARFFANGRAEMDAKSFPPVRFSELEMISGAQNRLTVWPEAAKAQGKWYLNYAVPIPKNSNEPVVGSMLVSFNLNELKKQLELNNSRLGKVSLIQQFSGTKPLPVLALGESDFNILESAKVPGSHFTVEFQPSRGLSAQTHANILLVSIILVVIGLALLAAGYLLGSVIGRRLMLTNETIQGAEATESGKLKPDTNKSTNILDIEISEEDQALFGFEEQAGETEENGTVSEVNETSEAEATPLAAEDILDIAECVPDEVFRAYDIRGLAGAMVNNQLAHKVGQAVASEVLDSGDNTLIIARDARLSSPELTEHLIRGVLSTGCDVLNIGTVPTPLMYFATEVLDSASSGVMVTASHNPADHNGFKIVVDGKCRSEDDIKAIRERILEGKIHRGAGQEHHHDIVPQYIDTIFSDVALAGEISIVVDAANAVAGVVAPRLFEELGCRVTTLYCDLDGSFPNHNPDPSVEANLQDLIQAVKEAGADLGVAFDGDGDRLAVVTPKGKIIWPDYLLMLYARDIVSRNPGADVVFDVKSTRHLNQCITDVGGRPIMWKTGHSPMKAKMQETGALLGGEFSGHIFIKDRWYGFDDGLYAAARLIEIISLQGQSIDELVEELPESIVTPEIRVAVDESKKFELIENLAASSDFDNAKITRIDGLRADFPEGWGLVRASNTGAAITLRFEADTPEFMHQLKALFVREIRKIDNTINIDWG